MAKESLFKGKTEKEFAGISTADYMKLTNARQRRSLKRGLTEQHKKLLAKIKKYNEGSIKKNIKTHCRDMIVVPEMLGTTIFVHTGKDFVPIIMTVEMLGHYLGEFTLTRRKVQHSAPGVGATKSSAATTKK